MAEALIAGGGLVDAILVLVLAEGAVLALWLRRGRDPALLQGLAMTLLSGAALLLALRAALTGAGAVWVLAWLAAALVAHLADLRLRLRR